MESLNAIKEKKIAHMKKRLLFFLVLCISQFSFGQTKDQDVEIVNHKVQANESVRLLSKKYLVDPAAIYKLNRFAINGISEGMVLQIPVQKKDTSLKQEVQSNDVSKDVASVVGSGQEEKEIAIELAINDELEANDNKNTAVIKHVVGPKETIFAVSKKYNVTVEAIQSVNSEALKNGLQVGQVLIIPSGKKINEKEIPAITPPLKKDSEKKDKVEEYIQHKVAPKETLYGLSKKYNVSVDEIKQKNEVVLQNGLQIGQILIIKKN